MARKVAIGIQDFETLREKNCFYIDKTEFIKEWWENGDSVTLITRPRRFGKTLNMDMLEKFFSLDYANRADLFEGLSIWQYEDYRKLQGNYPVISLSFAVIKDQDYETTKKKLYCILQDTYSKYEFLLESDKLSFVDKAFFKRMIYDMGEVEATMSLHYLSKFLYQYYGKKVIILLDEYDTPMLEAYVNGFWEELVSFIRSLFNATFKSNPYLERAIMTGIIRVSKESVFSDLNHLEVVSTTSDKYASAFGFTEEEVFQGLEECGFVCEKESVKKWYDGFTFGTQTDIYNPWSILHFLDKRKYGTYWANTSSNTLISKLLREGNAQTKMMFETLLKGESITCPVDEQIVYKALEGNETAIWSLLLASGYLKVIQYERIEKLEQQKVMYELKLTNHEVKRMFYGLVQDWFGETQAHYNNFIKAMLRNCVEEMNIYMNRVAVETFSYFDTGKSSFGEEPERFYYGFVLGLMAELTGEYLLNSNRESGYGRYDVMLEPLNKEKEAFILEFKVFNPKKEASLEETVQVALKQIEEKQYETSLISRGFQKEKIRQYGFAFQGKQVLIGTQ